MPQQAPSKAVTIRGERYPGLNISGKAYAPVPRRVESAHKNGGYTMIRCDWPEIYGIKCCEVEIEYKGQRFIGTAEVRMDFGRPIADAQTSAVGRALAFAGFDIETAIASAEDMASVLSERNETIIDAEPQALPAPADREQLLERFRRAEAIGLTGKPRMQAFEEWTGTSWNDLNKRPFLGDLEAIDIGLAEYKRPS